jgi:hypothetical protein
MGLKMLYGNYLSDPQCRLAIASDGPFEKAIVGHVFYKRFRVNKLKRDVIWITQMVVNSNYRHQKIAQTLLHAIMGTTCTCIGLASSHPYAVLALEKAVGRSAKASQAFARAFANDIITESGIPYLMGKEFLFQDDLCLINTEFFVDHDEPQAALDSIGQSWELGPLRDGHEFVAVIMK